MTDPPPGLGAIVVQRVLDALDPTPPHVEHGPDGFTWWPFACAQAVRVEGPANVAGEVLWRVGARLDLARGVKTPGRGFAALSRWNVAHPGLSALLWNSETGAVSLDCRVYVRCGDEPSAARTLASAALLQLGDGLHGAERLARELGGARADGAAPGTRVRAEPDALCEAWHGLVRGPDAAPALAGWLESASRISPAPWRHVELERGGCRAGLPLAPAAASARGTSRVGEALLHLRVDPPHPALGAGVLCVLQLPEVTAPEPARRHATAALLNEAEAREWTGLDGVGAWCVHPTAGLSHVSFHPAVLVDARLAEALAWTAGRRARWADAYLARVERLRAGN